jgi:hypothetical protein
LPGTSSVEANELDTCRPFPRPDRSAPQVPSVVGQALFDQLVAWIAINTSYDLMMVYTDPPTISFCQVGETIDYEHADLLVDASLLAAYDRQERHIFLTHPWSPLNLFDQSVLLHELIHDVQLENRDWDCPGAPEREAYLLQDKWLVEHGVEHAFDWRMISLLSLCQ